MKDYDKNVFLLCKKWMESVRTVTDVTGTIGAWRLLSSSLKTHQHSHVKETIYPSKWAVAVQEDIVKSIKNEYVSGENTRQVLEEITDNVYISVQTVKIPRNSGFDPTENNVTSSQYGRHIEEEIGRLLMYDQMMDCRLEAVHDSVFGDFLVSIFKLLCQRGILLVAKKMNITKEFDFPEPAKRRRGLDDAFTRPESFVINGQLDFMAYNVCTGRWCIIDSKYSTSPLPVSLSWAFQLFLYSCTVSKKYDLDYLPDGYVIYVNPTKHTISLLRVNYSWVLKTEHMLTEENRRILSSMYSSHYTKSDYRVTHSMLSMDHQLVEYLNLLTEKSGFLDEVKSKSQELCPFSMVLSGAEIQKINKNWLFTRKERDRCRVDLTSNHDQSWVDISIYHEAIYCIFEKKLRKLHEKLAGLVSWSALSLMVVNSIVPLICNVKVEVQKDPSLDWMYPNNEMTEGVHTTDIVAYNFATNEFIIVFVFINESGMTQENIMKIQTSPLGVCWGKHLKLMYDLPIYVLSYDTDQNTISLYEKKKASAGSRKLYEQTKIHRTRERETV